MGEVYNIEYCSAFANVFRSTLLNRILRGEHRSFLNPLLKESRYSNYNRVGSLKLGEVLDSIYSVLRTEYQCEYIYKDALAKRVLTDPHPSSAFTVFLVNNS